LLGDHIRMNAINPWNQGRARVHALALTRDFGSEISKALLT
jgi:methylmalonyl-CoA mutase